MIPTSWRNLLRAIALDVSVVDANGDQITSFGGGGGGAVTVADGADVTQGAKADAAITDSTVSGTLMAFTKGLVKILADVWDSINHQLKVTVTNGSLAVTGAFFQATQPVSITAALATTANLANETGGNLAAIAADTVDIEASVANIPAQGRALAAASMPVVMPAADITTLTPPPAITGFALEAGHLATIDTSTAALLVDTNDIETNTANLDTLLSTRLADATFTTRINTQGQKTMAASTPVVLASDQASIPVAATLNAETTKVIGTVNQGTSPWVVATVPPATSTLTRINPVWRQSIQLLASNAARKEALIVNETDAPMFLSESAAASDVAYVAQLPPRARYALDGTMALAGFWNQLPTTGQVVVTERV
jgi:hypothetical protein